MITGSLIARSPTRSGTLLRPPPTFTAPQSLDANLTTIAAIAPTNDDLIQRKGGLWVNRSMAQLDADISPAWTAYTPILTQAVTKSMTVNYAKYLRIGKMVYVNADLVVTDTSGTGAGNIITLSLPVLAAGASIANLIAPVVGTGFIYLPPITTMICMIARLWTANTFAFHETDGTVSPQSGVVGSFLGGVALNNTHQIGFSIAYEAE